MEGGGGVVEGGGGGVRGGRRRAAEEINGKDDRNMMRDKPRRPGPKTGSGVDLPTAEEIPAAPEYLQGYAREAWERRAPDFKALGISEADYMNVEAYCWAYETMREAVEALKGGRTYVTESGQIKLHPMASEKSRAISEMRQLSVLLGFTASARAKLPGGGGDAGPKDEQLTIFGMREE